MHNVIMVQIYLEVSLEGLIPMPYKDLAGLPASAWATLFSILNSAGTVNHSKPTMASEGKPQLSSGQQDPA